MSKDREPEDMALIYLQTFATPGGVEILSDLKKTFGGAWYNEKQGMLSAEEHNGALKVLEHILNKILSAGRKAGAEVIFKADCL